jgi:flagellar assembly protein FliH
MPSRSLLTLFADDFDAIDAAGRRAATSAPEPPPPLPTYSQEQLEAACAEARAEGYTRGIADAAVSEAATIAATLARIGEQLANAAEQAGRVAEENSEAFGKLLFSAMVAGFPLLRTQHGEAELRRMLKRAMPGLVREAHVTFKVHPTMVPVIQAELAAVPLKEQQHMTIEPTEAIPPGDARISWPYGGLVRDTVKIHNAITEILQPLGLLPDPAPADSVSQSR